MSVPVVPALQEAQSLSTAEAQRQHKRAKLAEALDALGYDAAAAVLRTGASGFITLPVSLSHTRDGREEAIACLAAAFDNERVACIVIER